MTTSDDVVTEHVWNPGRLRSNMVMYSETFALEDNPAIKFALFIKNNTGSHYGFPFGLQLQALEGTGSVDMHVRIWVQGENGIKSSDRIVNRKTFKSVGDKCEFIVLSNGKEQDAFYGSYNGRSLTVYCELKCLRHPPKAVLPLRQMLWAIYEKGIGADVIIKAGGKEFKVSSMILASQSGIFEQILSSNEFKEAEPKIIMIEDTAASVVESFVRYLHLGTAESDDPVEELFVLGNKYEISDLVIRCTDLMVETLAVENTAQRLILSRLYNMEALTRRIHGFINEMGVQTNVYESRAWCDYLVGNHAKDQDSILF